MSKIFEKWLVLEIYNLK